MSAARRTVNICALFTLSVIAALPAMSQSSNYVLGDQLYSYSTQAKPAKGQSFTDSTYHTTITRITNASADYGGWGVGTGYSTWDPMSSDGKYLILLGISDLSSADGYLLYDANTFKFIRRLSNLQWYNGQDPEPRWDTSGTYPSRIYYRKDKQLRYYDISTNTDALVRDFSADFSSYGSSYYIYNGEEGIPSRDSRYWAFMLGNGSSVPKIFVYDKTTNTIVASKSIGSNAPDNVGMSPSGNYVYVAYEYTGTGAADDGPHAYTRNFSSAVKLTGSVPHLAYGYTKQGHEVAVFMDQDYVTFVRLDNGQKFQLYYQGNLGWDASNLLHASQSHPGWGFISTYSENNNYWDYNQIFAIELDETKTYSSSTKPRIWRISFAQNIVGSQYYYQQPNAQMAWDGSRVWWGANWRSVSGTPDVYQATLPADWWDALNGTTPTTAALSTLTCTPTSINAGGSSTCTATLNMAAPSGGAAVAISDNTSALNVPTTATVAAGTTSTTFTALAATSVSATTSAVVMGNYGGVSKNATVTVSASTSAAALSAVSCSPTSFVTPGSTKCTVSLSGAAPSGGAAVALKSSSASLTVPGSVTVAAGTTSAAFTASATSVSTTTTATLTATYSGVSKSTSVSLSPAATVTVALASIACNPTTIVGPNSTSCTVGLTAAAPSTGAVVTLSASNSYIKVPSSLTVAAGASSAAFTIGTATVSANQTATATASYGGVSKAVTLTVTPSTPSSPTPVSVSISTPAASATVSGTISVTGSASGGTINKVELYVDSTLITSGTTASFSFSWNTTTVANGAHTILVKAYTTVGGTGCASRSVNVSNSTSTSTGSGPVAYWKFDETSGTTAKDSAGTSTGTVKGATWTTGKIAGALKFNGAGNVVNVNANTAINNLNAFTWSAWVYVAGNPGQGLGPVIEKGSGSSVMKTMSFNPINASYRPRTVYVMVHAGTQDAESVTLDNTYTAGAWEHWTVTYNNSGDRKLHIYKNGVETGYSLQAPAMGTVAADGSYGLGIGATPGTQYFSFNGNIDDVRIYNRVLTNSEILSLAQGKL